MIKRDEGYALPFVLVVLLVLVAIAVAIMDTSLRNLEAQQSAIQRMQSKYEAAGEMEKIFASTGVSKTAKFKEKKGTLLFLVEGNYLYVASAGQTDKNVWVIATFSSEEQDNNATEPMNENNGDPSNGEGEGTVVKTFNKDDTELTITGQIFLKEYKIVDYSTAMNHVKVDPKASGNNTPASLPDAPGSSESGEPPENVGGDGA